MKVLIIGGVAAGATTAARLRRLNKDVEMIVFEKGNYVSYANCGLPYHVGGEITDRNVLAVQTPASLKAMLLEPKIQRIPAISLTDKPIS